MREMTIEEIAELRLEYIKRLQTENALLMEMLEKEMKKFRAKMFKKSKSSYWNRDSLLKAASEEEE